jgi:hypothetical protein
MTKSGKYLLGGLTILPIIGFIGYIFVFFSIFFNISKGINPDNNLFATMQIMMLVMLLIVVSTIGLLIYYIVHAVNNKKIDSNERMMWILLFVFTSTIGFMVYWFTKIEVTILNNNSNDENTIIDKYIE